jgi:CDP-paratose 2-epimerase
LSVRAEAMDIAIVTGSAGLVGSEAASFFADLGLHVVGIDNNLRATFFGSEASTVWNRKRLQEKLGNSYTHLEIDIRDKPALEQTFKKYGKSTVLIVHTAAQPSHDWAATDPATDFSVNATGTLNLLEAVRKHSPDSVFIYTSTNKVYGDRPNYLPLVELETRWEISSDHDYSSGVREDMPVDQSLHSLFGVSKLAGDLLVQEFGRYFGLKTACFRGGCLTGPNHSGTRLHGFLSYLMRCTVTGKPYTVFGYGGKQVRDNIHSSDLVSAFHQFFLAPRTGEVYNIGGGRHSNCSMLEAISLCEQIASRDLTKSYSPVSRIGDHKWWISDNSRFKEHYPGWQLRYDVPSILKEIFEANISHWDP